MRLLGEQGTMMSEIKKSYVGVSGVTSPEMQTSLERAHMKSGLALKGRLIVEGVKATHKTQFLDAENKYGAEWYPVGEEAFTHALRHEYVSPVALPVAQMYLEKEEVASAEYRSAFIKRIQERGAPWLKGLQFDMLPWHNNDDLLPFLQEVKESTGLEILLQAHGPAMAELGAKGIVERLGGYAGAIDYLLFDASHGTGKRLDVSALEPFLAEAYARFDAQQTGIAIAGGLNAELVQQELPALLEQYPALSWDAEGQLHPVDAHGKRPLDLELAREYLEASSSLLPEVPDDPNATQRAILAHDFYWFGGPRPRAPFPHH